MMKMASLSTDRQILKASELMSKVVIIIGMNWRISVGVNRIVFVIRIVRSLILFLWYRIMTPGLPLAPLSLTKSQVLIIFWYIHLQSQRYIFFSGGADDGSSNYPYPASNIPSPS